MKEIKLDPKLASEIKKYGKFDATGCYACGSCTVVCELTTESGSFPRRPLLYARMGAKELVRGSLEPWLCYYCGDCSTTCPRQTEPAESMMTLRRYLMGQYDWTGFARRFFKSNAWLISAFITVGLAMLTLIILFFYPHHLLEYGHLFELIVVFAVAILVLIPNFLRMFWFVSRENNIKKLPLLVYFTEFIKMVADVITHKQLRKCPQKGFGISFWQKHLIVFYGYILTLSMAVFVGAFKTYGYPIYHPLKLAMIIIPAILFIFTAMLIIDRIKKREVKYKFSTLSDWVFSVWLFMMVFLFWSAYISLSAGFKELGYGIYIAHLVVLSQWALVIVPFGEWTHFIYRPWALYFWKLKEKASQIQPKRDIILTEAAQMTQHR